VDADPRQHDDSAAPGQSEMGACARTPRQLTAREVDRLGWSVAHTVHTFWMQDRLGPTWQQAFAAESVQQLLATFGLPAHRAVVHSLMQRIAGRGWVVFTGSPRSLCAGPSFFVSSPETLRVRSAEEVGRYVAQAVGTFRFRNHRSPRLDELAAAAFTRNGSLVFADAADLSRQLRWLVSSGWIRFEDKDIRRGHAAKTDRLMRMNPGTGGVAPPKRRPRSKTQHQNPSRPTALV